jgi:2-dehydro-3-deoxygluconokinase
MIQHKVFCLGEVLLRLSPDKHWVVNNNMPACVGGAELNVATALANWRIPVKYFTAMPDNYLSKQLVQYIADKGIDTSAINFSGNRIGIYYLPGGFELKHDGVIYDRANSSFAELKPGIIDWDKVLDGCTWFHFSAISPSVSANAAAICKEALKAAAAKGMTISVDLNYRSKLWQYGRLPHEVMPDLVRYCDVIMGNIWSVESLLNIQPQVKNSIGKTLNQLMDAATENIGRLRSAYPKAKTFAHTFRLENSYLATIQRNNDWSVSKQINITNPIDKAGSGDCFMAGLIYGLLKNNRTKDIIEFATAAAVGKLKEPGDSTAQTIEQINQMIKQ